MIIVILTDTTWTYILIYREVLRIFQNYWYHTYTWIKSPILEYYFCCGPKFFLHKSPRFRNKSRFWNSFAADQLVFQNRGFNVPIVDFIAQLFSKKCYEFSVFSSYFFKIFFCKFLENWKITLRLLVRKYRHSRGIF